MHNYAGDWTAGWIWMLYIGFIFLFFSSLGSWRYTYRAHRRFDGVGSKNARNILDERYARGEITRDQYGQMKDDVAAA